MHAGKDLIWYICLIYYSVLGSMGFLIGESSWGGILLIILILLIFIAYVINNHLIISINRSLKFIISYLMLFTIFCFLSSLWASNSVYAVAQAQNMFEIFVATSIMYLAFQNEKDVDELLELIMYGGYIFAIIVAVFYGFSGLMSLFNTGGRISTITNANTIGNYTLYSALISFYYISKKKNRWLIVTLVPLLFILVLSGSRKVFIALVVGVLLYFVFNSIGKGKGIPIVFRISFIVIGLIAIVFVLSRVPALDFVFARINAMLETISGKNLSDSSTRVRLQLQEIGLSLFKEHPFLGIGIDNAGIYGGQAFGMTKYYLHGNYIELLADVGLIGTALYYSIYCIMLFRLIKYRDFTDREYNICFTILIIRLILDYGTITYSDKASYIFLIMLWSKTCGMKQKYTMVDG